MRVHTATLRAGISITKEFEKKGLAQFAVNVGTKCGHGCLYCNTGARMRIHPHSKAVSESPPYENPFVCWKTARTRRVVVLSGVWSSLPAPAHANA